MVAFKDELQTYSVHIKTKQQVVQKFTAATAKHLKCLGSTLHPFQKKNGYDMDTYVLN